MGPNPASWLFTSLIPHPHREWQMWDACLLCFLECPPPPWLWHPCLPVWQEIFPFTVASGERYPSSFLLFLLPAFPFLSTSSQSIVGNCNSWFQWWPEQKATRGEGLNFPGFSIKVLVPFSLFEVDFIPLQAWGQELWGNLEDGYGQIEEIWAKQGEAG